MMRQESKSKKSNKKQKIVIAIVIMAIIVLAVVGIVIFQNKRTFTGISVNSIIEMGNSGENAKFYNYNGSFVKCTENGLTFFSSTGITRTESFSLSQPIIDISGKYIAVADKKQQDVYLYDENGLVGRISFGGAITDISVSNQGVMAAACSDGDSDFIMLKDKTGSEIATIKSIFSSTGYLMDIALSPDGTKLAAAYARVDGKSLNSQVKFYDFSSGKGDGEVLKGTFNQYTDSIAVYVAFLGNNNVAVVADNGLSFYEFSSSPKLVSEELNTEWEIQSVFSDTSHVGLIISSDDDTGYYKIKVYDKNGECGEDISTDFQYSAADFAGNNVLLYSYQDFALYGLDGNLRISYMLDEHIEAMKSANGTSFAVGLGPETEFITLK